jgi:hypothetical protein
VEINDEMIVAERRYLTAASMAAFLNDTDRLRPYPQHPAPDDRSHGLHHATGLNLPMCCAYHLRTALLARWLQLIASLAGSLRPLRRPDRHEQDFTKRTHPNGPPDAPIRALRRSSSKLKAADGRELSLPTG